MTRQLRKLALFLCGLALCLLAASVYFELRVRRNDDFYRQVAEFRQPDVQPRVLLVGDSRMAVDIDPRLLPPSVYNFSYPGETLRHLYLRIKFALESKPSIEYVVLGLEDVLFSDARAVLRDATRQMAFADLVDLTEIYPSSPRFLLRHAVLHFLPLVNAGQRRRAWEALLADLRALATGRQAEAAVRLDCGGGLRFLRRGRWQAMDTQRRSAVARSEVERLLGGSAANPAMHAVLDRILELARRHGVRVIGLRSPVSGSYLKAAYAYYDKSPLSFLDRERLYGLLDYETLFAGRTRSFYNADHLNPQGAAAFTERLVADLQRLTPIVDTAPRRCLPDNEPARLAWPYNDVLSPWLSTPACLNLRGSCGAGPATQPASARNARSGSRTRSPMSRGTAERAPKPVAG